MKQYEHRRIYRLFLHGSGGIETGIKTFRSWTGREKGWTAWGCAHRSAWRLYHHQFASDRAKLRLLKSFPLFQPATQFCLISNKIPSSWLFCRLVREKARIHLLKAQIEFVSNRPVLRGVNHSFNLIPSVYLQVELTSISAFFSRVNRRNKKWSFPFRFRCKWARRELLVWLFFPFRF